MNQQVIGPTLARLGAQWEAGRESDESEDESVGVGPETPVLVPVDTDGPEDADGDQVK